MILQQADDQHKEKQVIVDKGSHLVDNVEGKYIVCLFLMSWFVRSQNCASLELISAIRPAKIWDRKVFRFQCRTKNYWILFRAVSHSLILHAYDLYHVFQGLNRK